jgi:hypothetical protein
MAVDSHNETHHFDEEQDPDRHWNKKLDRIRIKVLRTVLFLYSWGAWVRASHSQPESEPSAPSQPVKCRLEQTTMHWLIEVNFRHLSWTKTRLDRWRFFQKPRSALIQIRIMIQ